MYSSYSLSKRLVTILSLLVIQVFIRNVSSLNMTNAYLNHKCLTNQGKYKTGSEYERLLKSLINMIPPSKFDLGFTQSSISKESYDLNILFQCRGDILGSKCHSCFTKANAELRKRCPNYKGGLIWYDHCLVEISTVDTKSKIDYDNNFCMSNKMNINGNLHTFKTIWMNLINNLSIIASNENNKIHGVLMPYAAGKSNFKKENIYGMVQCTGDVWARACKDCLSHLIVHFQDCLKDKRGGRVFGRSCGFRFEFYPFLISNSDFKYI